MAHSAIPLAADHDFICPTLTNVSHKSAKRRAGHNSSAATETDRGASYNFNRQSSGLSGTQFQSRRECGGEFATDGESVFMYDDTSSDGRTHGSWEHMNQAFLPPGGDRLTPHR